MNALVIAEAGVNHNGDLTIAKRLVDAAAEARADIVKFQTFSADRLVTANARPAEYQARSTGGRESQREMLRRLELTREMHEVLIAHCKSIGIEFLSTGFDIASIDLLVALGVGRLKIPSGEITNLPYLRHAGESGLPIIISTGMATLDEVEAAVNILLSAGTRRDRVTVLHCTTEYPADPEDVNLRAMQTLRDTLGIPVGLSDHTTGIDASIAAVAMGATVIEKHFTLDRALPGPDHAASLEPAELTRMVSAIRNVERMMGDGVKRPARGEEKNRSAARKSLVAARRIGKGEAFTAENMAVKRPGDGVSPMRWDEALGRTASRDFEPDELIEL